MKKIIVATALLVAFGAIAGPFGLSKGMTLGQIKKKGAFVSDDNPSIYSAKTITNGNPDFGSYSVIITKEQGLCRVQAFSKDIKANSFGHELKGKYRNLVEAVSKKYGSPSQGYDFDFLLSGSIWKEPQDWMMSLVKKERKLQSSWHHEADTKLPDSLESITIETFAFSNSEGFLSITYEFDNIGACLETVKAKKNEAF